MLGCCSEAASFTKAPVPPVFWSKDVDSPEAVRVKLPLVKRIPLFPMGVQAVCVPVESLGLSLAALPCLFTCVSAIRGRGADRLDTNARRMSHEPPRD